MDIRKTQLPRNISQYDLIHYGVNTNDKTQLEAALWQLGVDVKKGIEAVECEHTTATGLKVEIIGNLGADAQLQEKNGNKFVAFRVANTDKWIDKSTGQVIESTQWISCTLNGDGGALLPYLKKGTKVFVRGNAQFVIFSSAKTRQMEVGVNLFVREIELCDGQKENQQTAQQPQQPPQQTTQQPAYTPQQPG